MVWTGEIFPDHQDQHFSRYTSLWHSHENRSHSAHFKQDLIEKWFQSCWKDYKSKGKRRGHGRSKRHFSLLSTLWFPATISYWWCLKEAPSKADREIQLETPHPSSVRWGGVSASTVVVHQLYCMVKQSKYSIVIANKMKMNFNLLNIKRLSNL